MALIRTTKQCVTLTSPSALPSAGHFLWNKSALLQVNCQGYVSAQFMQPEPSKYTNSPTLEAASFMQPEPAYFSHHPGRFFYIKETQTSSPSHSQLWSVPFAPVANKAEKFEFIAHTDRIEWHIRNNDFEVKLTVRLHPDHALELWEFSIVNTSNSKRTIDVYPYFPFGYRSWMHQQSYYLHEANALVCKAISPYQKTADYFKQKDFKDLTALIAEVEPRSFEGRQSAFEGGGNLANPEALTNAELSNSEAHYEVPTAALQYTLLLKPKDQQVLRFAFGPAQNKSEIEQLRDAAFTSSNWVSGNDTSNKHPNTTFTATTPLPQFDHFVNLWLPRQMHYHKDLNRMTTDPQTRNYLQDAMGVSYLDPAHARDMLTRCIKQQHSSGALPDGILLNASSTLKYINQIPHTDHAVWLPIALEAYLDESDDLDFLNTPIGFSDSNNVATVFEHVCMALNHLALERDERGLSYIGEGDWCDPMNMVGYKGKGVSAWLSMASAYAFRVWANTCAKIEKNEQQEHFLSLAEQCNSAVNHYLWSSQWYARGITDDGRTFGVDADTEGKIFLNPQTWALLSGAASAQQKASLLAAVDAHLLSPSGVELLAPSFTKMHEDIGRVTQKFAGSAENGSVYNHAAAFYIFALYQVGESERAFDLVCRMLPGIDDDQAIRHGQLPTFIPNYYRGAHRQYPRTAGRSSQLFNTGTIHWLQRSLVEGLFGVRGQGQALYINPQLPASWESAHLTRHFRGADFKIHFTRSNAVDALTVTLNGKTLPNALIPRGEGSTTRQVTVQIPQTPK